MSELSPLKTISAYIFKKISAYSTYSAVTTNSIKASLLQNTTALKYPYQLQRWKSKAANCDDGGTYLPVPPKLEKGKKRKYVRRSEPIKANDYSHCNKNECDDYVGMDKSTPEKKRKRCIQKSWEDCPKPRKPCVQKCDPEENTQPKSPYDCYHKKPSHKSQEKEKKILELEKNRKTTKRQNK